MTKQITNEAAERLRGILRHAGFATFEVDEALAAERRATMAAAVRYASHGRTPPPNDPCESCALAVDEVLAMIEEAAR